MQLKGVDGQEEQEGDDAKSIAEDDGVNNGEDGYEVGDDGGVYKLSFPAEVMRKGDKARVNASPSRLFNSPTIIKSQRRHKGPTLIYMHYKFNPLILFLEITCS